MKISYNWLQDLIKEKLPKPEKLADLLTMHSFETDYLGNNILDVDVLPNRAHDCLCHLGIAREIAAILNLNLKLNNYSKKIKNNKLNIKKYLNIKVEDKDSCLRYTSRAVANINIKNSSKLIQDRLIACGLRPINNIVDIANYVMLETGQPLHAFDADKIDKNIIIRKAKTGEKFISLDNEKYELDKDVLLITDSKKPLCIAGIKGGISPEIDKKTKNIILEAANFSAVSIRKTSQKLKLRTDASVRFEHELDPNLTEQAINMAAYLIQEYANGDVLNNIIDIYPKKIRSRKIKLNNNKARKLLGINILDKEIKNILYRLGIENNIIPTRRIDIKLQEDLIEEIGRIYGYDNIKSQFPKAALIPPKTNEDLVYQNKVRDILSGFGFDEVYNYSFVGDKENNIIEIANPVSQEQKYLRSDLITNLIKNIKENKKYFNNIKIFELGRVFCDVIPAKAGIQNIKEAKKIGAIICLKNNNFYELKGVLDSLLNKLRITDQWYDDSSNIKKGAEIKVGNENLGWIKEINHQDILCAGFELDFDKLVELATEERIYLPPSKYPSIVRDIAVLVDSGTKVVEVLNLINAAGGTLVRDVDLFDIYEDESKQEAQKSIAFHIIYQSNNKNLTDKEVNKIHEKIIRTLEQEGGWEVRR